MIKYSLKIKFKCRSPQMRTSPSSLFQTSPSTLPLTLTCWSISHQSTQRTVNMPSWSEMTAELTHPADLPSSMHFNFYLARVSLSALFNIYIDIESSYWKKCSSHNIISLELSQCQIILFYIFCIYFNCFLYKVHGVGPNL